VTGNKIHLLWLALAVISLAQTYVSDFGKDVILTEPLYEALRIIVVSRDDVLGAVKSINDSLSSIYVMETKIPEHKNNTIKRDNSIPSTDKVFVVILGFIEAPNLLGHHIVAEVVVRSHEELTEIYGEP
jgi:hypothetical protein